MYWPLLFSSFLTGLICGISVEDALTLENIKSLKDYRKYIQSVRKLYLRPRKWQKGQIGTFSGPPRVPKGLNLAEPAACIPENTIVPISIGRVSSSTQVFPTCTRVQRCGGCCSHQLLSCQPTETEEVLHDVFVIDTELNQDRIESVNITRHLGCSCQCKVKEEHCNHLQDYHPSECRCVCNNLTEKKKCLELPNKFWDESSCRCKCRDEDMECITGEKFSKNSCRCESFIDGLERKFGRRFRNDIIGMRMMEDIHEDSELKKKPFETMDTNGDNFLTFVEMRDTLTPIGVTIMEIGKIISQADMDEDLRINHQEFELLRSSW